MAASYSLPARSFDVDALKAALDAAVAGDPATITSRYDAAVTALLNPSTVPVTALVFNNLEPIQFSDGFYLELAA